MSGNFCSQVICTLHLEFIHQSFRRPREKLLHLLTSCIIIDSETQQCLLYGINILDNGDKDYRE